MEPYEDYVDHAKAILPSYIICIYAFWYDFRE
jgi:hypothetical protein